MPLGSNLPHHCWQSTFYLHQQDSKLVQECMQLRIPELGHDLVMGTHSPICSLGMEILTLYLENPSYAEISP